VTLELATLSLLVALAIGVPLGALAATHRGRALDRLAGLLSLTGISLPSFWLGTLLVLVFTLGLHLLPSGGHVSLGVSVSKNLRHMILPSLALGLAVGAVVARMTRSSMLEVLECDWVRTARAKGLTRSLVVLRHVLRPALLPVLTALGVQAGYLLAGSVVIEDVFSLPGLGRLALEALGNRDYPLLQGTLLVFGASFVLVSLAVDVSSVALDPRFRR
jgi:peptide/nickel transport system permease protein